MTFLTEPAQPTSGPAPPPRKAWRVRPLEWAILGFLVFVLVRAGPDAFVAWRELAGGRTVTVLCAFGVVVFVYLVRAFASRPWPARARLLSRMHWLTLPFALGPLLLGIVFALQGQALREVVSGTPLPRVMVAVSTAITRVSGFGLPPLLLWLAAGIDVKTHGGLDLRRFIKTLARQLVVAARDWAPLLLVLSGYAWMEAVIEVKPGEGRDDWMLAADRFLFLGHDPLDLLERVISRPLSEWLAFSYSFYALMFPLAFGGVLLFGGRPALREAAFAISAALLVAYLGYTFFPVKGPILTRTFQVPLDMYLIGPIKAALMDATRINYDCFPSMHTGCSMILAWAAWRHVRKLFWAMLPMAASIPFACVYLRYHYVIDVLAGATVAVAAMVVTMKLRPILVADLPEAPPAGAPTPPA